MYSLLFVEITIQFQNGSPIALQLNSLFYISDVINLD